MKERGGGREGEGGGGSDEGREEGKRREREGGGGREKREGRYINVQYSTSIDSVIGTLYQCAIKY